MGVSMTSAAANHVARYLEKRGKGVGIRLGVRTSGCSGMAYVLEYVDDLNTEDEVFEFEGVKVVTIRKAWSTWKALSWTLSKRV